MDSVPDLMVVARFSLEVGCPISRVIVPGSLEIATGTPASSEAESLKKPNSGLALSSIELSKCCVLREKHIARSWNLVQASSFFLLLLIDIHSRY